MRYRNGREAKNGDRIVRLGADGKVEAVGILYDAVPGNRLLQRQHRASPAGCRRCLHGRLPARRRRGGGAEGKRSRQTADREMNLDQGSPRKR